MTKPKSISPVKSKPKKTKVANRVTRHKWEHEKFIDRVLKQDWPKAMYWLSHVSKPETAQKWMDDERISEYLEMLLAYVYKGRHDAGINDWKYWQKVADETNYKLGIKTEPTKSETPTFVFNFGTSEQKRKYITND